MELPEAFITQSFRYVLGRMTYAVYVWVDWCVENWNDIPEGQKNTIIRELEEAFKHDDRDRKAGKEWKTLGDDCDRAQWERVRDLYSDCCNKCGMIYYNCLCKHEEL